MTLKATFGIGLPGAGASVPVRLEFDPSPDEVVAGYALYYGEANGTATNRVDLGDRTWMQLESLSPNTRYFFYVVAYTKDQIESLPSNKVYYTPPRMTRIQLAHGADGHMRLTFRVPARRYCRIEFATSLIAPRWLTAGYAAANQRGEVEFIDFMPNDIAKRFYRVVLLP